MSPATRSLRHDEARARAALLRVSSYAVELDLAADDHTFGSRTTIVVESTGGPTFLDVHPRELRSASLDGRLLDVGLLADGRLPLETGATTHTIVVDAVMGFRNDGEGLHRSVDPADGRHYVYGMSFMDAAPSVFACFDQPDLKATVEMHVRAPRDWVVVGNSPAERVGEGEWHLPARHPLSTYFVTLVAGPYHLVREEHDGIPLGLSARASLAGALEADAEEMFSLTRAGFDEYHRLFGIRYPFGDYHQAFVPEFNAGAMENPGCVTIRDPLVFTSRPSRADRVYRAVLVAHEMAHQWFGNLTTPRWWDDLWLNESFADHLGYRVAASATDFTDAWVEQSWRYRMRGLTDDCRPSTHPVAGNGAADARSALQDFDGISYTKGSNVVRQIAARWGDEVFFDGVRDHLTRHRFGNATLHDLFDSWVRAGATDLAEIAEPWLRAAGADTVRHDRAGGRLLLERSPASPEAARRHAFTAAVAGPDGTWERREVVLDAAATPFDVGDAPVVLDADERGWARYVPDAHTVAGLPALLGEEADLDPLLRAAAWSNVRSGFHAARVDPRAVVDVVAARYPAEDSADRGQHLLPWLLAEVVPAAGGDALGRVHDAARARLAEEASGSEAQLAALRAAVRTAVDVAWLRGLLAGAVPDGVALDDDLRWRVLVRLAALGDAGASELDAALAADPTAQARVEHAHARAACPTPEAKEWAWGRFTGTDDVSNYEVLASGEGLWQGGQEHLTAPYVTRYFDEVADTAQVRTGWLLADAAAAFFPTAVSPDVLAQAQAVLARDDLDLSLRRKLADATDDLARAVAVRAAFPR